MKLIVGVGQLRRRFEAEIEIRIARPVGRELLELDEQRRHQVERDPHVRKFAKERHHAVVVLQRVQSHPRQDVLAGHEVLVIRLVHVPQQGDASHTL